MSGEADTRWSELLVRIRNSPDGRASLMRNYVGLLESDQTSLVDGINFLAEEILSADQSRAMAASDLMVFCWELGGECARQQLLKFRVLNQLLKLLSPRHLAATTDTKLRQRAADILHSWSCQMPDNDKIQQVMSVVHQQALLQQHQISARVIGVADILCEDSEQHQPISACDSEHKFVVSTIDSDSCQRELLRRLLRSRHAQDLQAANQLIMSMVEQEERRVELIGRRQSQLELAHASVSLMCDIIDNLTCGAVSRHEVVDVMADLQRELLQCRDNLNMLAAQSEAQDIDELVDASDEISAILQRYDLVFNEPSDDVTASRLCDNVTPASCAITHLPDHQTSGNPVLHAFDTCGGESGAAFDSATVQSTATRDHLSLLDRPLVPAGRSLNPLPDQVGSLTGDILTPLCVPSTSEAGSNSSHFAAEASAQNELNHCSLLELELMMKRQLTVKTDNETARKSAVTSSNNFAVAKQPISGQAAASQNVIGCGKSPPTL